MTRKQGGERNKAKALDKGLKSMFRALEQRPVPKPIRDVAEQLGPSEPGKPSKPKA